MGWKITHDGHEWRETDLTLGEAEKVCEITKTSWGKLTPIESPTHLAAIISVFQARSGTPIDESLAKVRALPAIELLKTVSFERPDLPEVYEDGFPPKADGPSTS